MADRPISELTEATVVTDADMFVLQQSNVAKKLTGRVFRIWALNTMQDHGGIDSIEKTATSGLTDTYTITFADDSTTTFTVSNGKSITEITKTGTDVLEDTYTIAFNDSSSTTYTVTNGNGITNITKTTSGLTDTYTLYFGDGTTYDFDVDNGRSITNITKTDTTGLVDTYTISYNDNTNTTFTVTNGAKGDPGDNTYTWIKYSATQPTQDSDMHDTADAWMGIYWGNASTAPTTYTSYTWYNIKGDKGDTGDDITITSTSTQYASSDNQTTIPSQWSNSIPLVPPTYFLWTKVQVVYSDGNSTLSYSVARQGRDGSGSVSTVNNVGSDPNGNVNVMLTVGTAVQIPISDTSTTVTLTGLTEQYELIKWNFSSSPENCPPVNLSWSTTTDSFTVSNTGGVTLETIKPVFAIPASESVS